MENPLGDRLTLEVRAGVDALAMKDRKVHAIREDFGEARPGLYECLDLVVQSAGAIGQALADRLALPFHFASPETPDDEAPRWRDSLGLGS